MTPVALSTGRSALMAGLLVAALGCVGSETRGDDDRFSLEVFANPPPQYAARDEKVRSVVERLRSIVRVVSSVEQIPVEISSAGVAPSLTPTDSAGMQMSVQHRRVIDGDLYFLFNESYEQHTDRLRIEGTFDEVVLLDPESGEPAPTSLEGDLLTVTLPAVRGIVLWVRHDSPPRR
jgi:hypothetical protein